MLGTKFISYSVIGLLNTCIHALIFLSAHPFIGQPQSIRNLVAFGVATSFSFCMNSKFTFKAPRSSFRYCLFMSFMAALSFGTGQLADHFSWPAWLTLVLFTLLSLVCGFLFSNYIVFRNLHA